MDFVPANIANPDEMTHHLAVLSEFERYLLCIKVTTNTCKFCRDCLLLIQCYYKVHIKSSLIATRDKNELDEKMSWMACVAFILKHTGVSSKLAYHQHFSSIVKTYLINRFQNNLNSTLFKYKNINEGKLRTCALFQKEKYLSVIKDTEIRNCY